MFVKATLAATCVFLALIYSVTGNETVTVDENQLRDSTKKTKRKKKYPPGPKGMPYFGVHFQVSPGEMHKNLEKWKRQYGDIISFKILGQNIVVLNSPELIRKAFESEEFASLVNDRPPNFIGKYVMYNYRDVLLNRYSESFRKMKKLMVSCINKHGFSSKHFQDIADEEFRCVLNQFHAQNGQAVDAVKLLMPSFCKLIGGFFSGKHLKDGDPILESIIALDHDGDIMIQPQVHGVLSKFPWLRRCCGFYGNLYSNVIQQRESLFKSLVTDMKETLDKDNVKCYSHDMLSCKETNGCDWLTDQHINGMLMDLINTSVLTTKSVMSGMIFMWLHLPDVQQKMRDEIDQVIGRERLPTIEDRKNLPYVQACIYELLRYQSHLPLTAAHANIDHEVEIEGYTIQKGSVIFGNLYGAHHDEELWNDPWEFRPERYLTDNGTLVPKDHAVHRNSIAFGVGDRKCVGRDMAYNRMFLYAVHLLRTFEFQPEEDTVLPPHDPRQFAISAPVILPNVYKCRAIPR
ncbi:vitamin D(3) 25-hydroxylase-like [Ylistrum balloti]|uniref:vitamin D(3) 25-hydroxylase-like n=1 Tax=Ylistrum balloti TaxID=509963 RepID=UPI002905A88D|nr:vitamin D(3) 25-hydroxylase-like [Ylistrum balloti]